MTLKEKKDELQRIRYHLFSLEQEFRADANRVVTAQLFDSRKLIVEALDSLRGD